MDKLVPRFAGLSAGKDRASKLASEPAGSLFLSKRAAPTWLVSISRRAMMHRLVQNAGGMAPFPLVRADASSLPFIDDSFAAAVAVHVLHLIPEWRHALGNSGRVVRPSGPLVIDIGRQTQGPFPTCWPSSRPRQGSPRPTGEYKDTEELDAAMAVLGASLTQTDVIEEVRSATYAKTIQALEGAHIR